MKTKDFGKNHCAYAHGLHAFCVRGFPRFLRQGRSEGKTVEDIFKSTQSNPEFSGVKREFTLDTGWTVYTTSVAPKSTQAVNVNSDVGYITSLDAFVVSNGDVLSIVKCGDTKEYFDGGMKGMILPASLGISALRVKDGLIACKFNDYTAGVFDSNGRTVISRTKINWSSNSGANIDAILKSLTADLSRSTLHTTETARAVILPYIVRA